LACGAELTLHGITATIDEANKIPGGLDLHGISPYTMTDFQQAEFCAHLAVATLRR
jgi:hypothetical protein